MTAGRLKRLTKKDWRAIRNALAFTLAGEWDESSHGDTTPEDMAAAMDKVRERIPPDAD